MSASRRTGTRLLAVTGLIVLSATATAADGKKLYAEKACGTCHGPRGDAPILSTYPKIAGQNTPYLVRQMNDFKSGDRDNAASIAMRGIAEALSDDEIVALAEYLSTL